jgi:hypothetical protein
MADNPVPHPKDWLSLQSEENTEILQTCFCWDESKQFYDTRNAKLAASKEELDKARKLLKNYAQWRCRSMYCKISFHIKVFMSCT